MTLRKTAGFFFAALTLCAIAATPAHAAFGLTEFKSEFLDANGNPEIEAGAHPYAVKTSFRVQTKIDPELGEIPDGAVKTAHFPQPAGFIGSRTSVPSCSSADFLAVDENGYNDCPDATAVGVVQVFLTASEDPTFSEPVYNLDPPPGVAAKLGFIAFNTPTTIEVGLNDKQPYNLLASTVNIPQTSSFYGAELELWGTPADHSHDALRGSCLVLGAPGPDGEPASRGICDTGAEEVPWLTMPRSCTGPLLSTYEAVSWQSPNAEPDRGSFAAPGMTGCSQLGLSPSITSKPTASGAESATGLDFDVALKDEGLYNPNGRATQSEIKKALVTLPAGMTVNPSSANGLDVCPRAAYEAESLASGQLCPNASKVGEVEVESPLLAKGETLGGQVFLASQQDNPFGTLIALYMVIKDPELGALVKLPIKVEPSEERGPNAGRLITTLDEAPQVPVSSFRFHFTEGPRGALITPPACGTYVSEALFTPWSDPSGAPSPASSPFQITSGVAGGPCPAGAPPFKPTFSAGSINNNAGAYSPFNMRLTRADGEQEMTRFDAVLPRGVTGKLAGIARCPDAALALAKAKSGREELAVPSCPAASQIGTSLSGAGVGGTLTWVPGKIYLGGRVGRAPLSVIAITPAVAGPFDIGTVVVREALTVDPESAEVKVDGSISDPIPNVLRGIPVKLRDLRVYTDRPNFTLNPTSCAPKQAQATLFGSFLDPFSPADDAPAQLTDRYQAASCASLKFKPKLNLRLKGGTKRGAHPALRATLTYPKGAGYANIKKAVVTLARSSFLEQAHIRTVCTRVQFAAESCPKGSVYGKARAFTPLLDEPLEGPVYLRSSSNPLPDMVIALKGLVDFNLVGRIDSVNASIRATFATVPDAPVSKFVLNMQGGKKGLIVNSRNLCAHKSRAHSELTAQNGALLDTRPVVKPRCGGKKK